MKNVYGTKEHKKYIDNYLNYLNTNFESYKIKEDSINNGIFKITCETHLYTNKACRGEQSFYKVYKNKEKIYETSSIEEFLLPFFIKIKNDPCLFLKTSLYGFTILNLNTRSEYNYFPKIGLEGEAFIVTNAWSFKDILLFEGCYWGGMYGYYFFQPSSEKGYYFSNKFEDYFLSSVTVEPKIKEDRIILTDDEGNEISLSYNDIISKLNDEE